jgi:hypothetical protein
VCGWAVVRLAQPRSAQCTSALTVNLGDELRATASACGGRCRLLRLRLLLGVLLLL